MQGSKAVASAISPDDQLLAVISRDGLLRFWDMRSSELMRITEAAVLQATGVSSSGRSCSSWQAARGTERCVCVSGHVDMGP